MSVDGQAATGCLQVAKIGGHLGHIILCILC